MLKRGFDMLASGLGLILLLPLLAAIAVWIRCDSPGPVFFRQTRVGREGRPFRIYKFRTMVTDAEKLGRAVTVAGDPRITRSGRWLRRSKLDELPQLLNVLLGDMSLVGPRPEVPRYVALYDLKHRRVLSVRPGITDWASIKYRNENELLAAASDPERVYIERILPDKLRINLEYIDRRSFGTDLEIIWKTGLRILERENKSRTPVEVKGRTNEYSAH